MAAKAEKISKAGKAKKSATASSSTTGERPLKWTQSAFTALCDRYDFEAEWQVTFPGNGKRVTDVPPGKIVLYAEFFTSCNFRLPATVFVTDVLAYYGVHISQVHSMGMCRIRHFEFACRAQGVEPLPERLNVFYQATFTNGFLSFRKRTGIPACAGKAPSSYHDWAEKFFFIHVGVIPVAMSHRPMDHPIEDRQLIAYGGEAWFEKLIAHPVRIKEIPEAAMVAVGMSRLWDDPNRYPVCVLDNRGM